MEIAMVLFGVLTVAAACGVVLSRKTLHSALWLVTTFFLVAVHFAILGADFLAALQILVYAGAIMVLVVFVIMLLGINEDADTAPSMAYRFLCGAFCVFFVGMLLFAISTDVVFPVAQGIRGPGMTGSPQAIGKVLTGEFVFPFEASALLLLAAIVGAVILAFEEKRPLPQGRGLRGTAAPKIPANESASSGDSTSREAISKVQGGV